MLPANCLTQAATTSEISTLRAGYTREPWALWGDRTGRRVLSTFPRGPEGQTTGRFFREPSRTPVNPQGTTINPTDLVSQLRVPHIINTPHPRRMRPWPHGQQAVLLRVTKGFSQDQRPQAAFLCSASIHSLLSFTRLGNQVACPWPQMKGDRRAFSLVPSWDQLQSEFMKSG